jgi:translation initiation factor IF-3
MQPTNNQRETQYRVRINNYIRVPQIRVILSNGENGGIMDTWAALKLAQEEGLDLIEINPKAMPPVCKIANYGKMKYEDKKKAQAAKKTQLVQELKELTFRPNTDENDLNHKLAQAKQFIADCHRVKFAIRFRGREIVHTNIGRTKMEWIIKQLEGTILPNPPITMEGKLMLMITSPVRK